MNESLRPYTESKRSFVKEKRSSLDFNRKFEVYCGSLLYSVCFENKNAIIKGRNKNFKFFKVQFLRFILMKTGDFRLIHFCTLAKSFF